MRSAVLHRLSIPLLATTLALAVPGCAAVRADDDDDGGGRPYRVGAVDRGPVRVRVEETGVVEPERQVVVKSPISGVVEELAVREGDRVRPGQVLARIVPDIAQANTFATLRSQIAQAEITEANARREYERAQALARTDGITRAELDARRLAFEQAENALGAARDQLALVQRSGVRTGEGSQYALLRAPSGGVVIMRGVEVGETVVGGTSAFGGGTELFTIADLSALVVRAAINEVDIGKVRVGDSVQLSVDAFPTDTVPGVVRLVPPAARQQERVRVFDVEVRALGDGGVLRPGMTANVRIQGPTKLDALRVPVEAVMLDEGQPVVWLVKGPGEPVRTPVTLGLGDLAWAEVLAGVQPGDTVALEDPAAAVERAGRTGRAGR